MQSPNCDNRDNQNHEIAHNIDDASTDEHGILINAFLSFCCFVGFADAFGRNGEDEGERIEEVPVEDEPDARVGVGISVPISMKTKSGISGLL